jgi:hypothetical protein
MLRPPLLLDDAGTIADLTEVQQVKAEAESSTSSCLCLGRRNIVRVPANKITESAAFTKTVMIVIILNCVLMTTADYRPECLTADYRPECLTADYRPECLTADYRPESASLPTTDQSASLPSCLPIQNGGASGGLTCI